MDRFRVVAYVNRDRTTELGSQGAVFRPRCKIMTFSVLSPSFRDEWVRLGVRFGSDLVILF